MYLPQEIHKARVLIAVKTYPMHSGKDGELVSAAGLLDGKKWVRIYPLPYTLLTDDSKYKKYSYIELDLIRNKKDFRPESYLPLRGLDEEIKVVEKLNTVRSLTGRRNLVLREVFTSMHELIYLAKGKEKKSLATLKPLEIIDFVIEDDDRRWKEKWLVQAKQGNFFEILESECPGQGPYPVRKLPYRYYYRFLSQGDVKPRKLMIADWELGTLFWNCLKKTAGDEQAANQLVRQEYLGTMQEKKEVYFFLGTSRRHHNVSPNPFMIIGVFLPPPARQPSLF
jgi:hypothetical protein